MSDTTPSGDPTVPSKGIEAALRDLRDHIAQCDPQSLWIAFCDEWLHRLAQRSDDPIVVGELRRDLLRGGDLAAVRLPRENRRLAHLRIGLSREIHQQLTSVPLQESKTASITKTVALWWATASTSLGGTSRRWLLTPR
jgi:hypothetical protein